MIKPWHKDELMVRVVCTWLRFSRFSCAGCDKRSQWFYSLWMAAVLSASRDSGHRWVAVRRRRLLNQNQRGKKKTLKLLSHIVTRNCACPASCFLDHNWFLVTIFHIELDPPSLEEKLDAYSPDACVWTCMIVFVCAPCITLFTTVMSLMPTPRCHIESVELCS